MQSTIGSSFVIDSEDPEEWAAAIKEIWNKDRQGRLDEAETLRTSYGKKYNWAKQSRGLLDKMISIVHGMAFQFCCIYTVTCVNWCKSHNIMALDWCKRRVGMKHSRKL